MQSNSYSQALDKAFDRLRKNQQARIERILKPHEDLCRRQIARAFALAAIGAVLPLAQIGGYYMDKFSADSAQWAVLWKYDCRTNLEGQTYGFKEAGDAFGLFDKRYGTATIVGAQKADNAPTPNNARYFDEIPVRLTGRTDDGRVFNIVVSWDKEWCGPFRAFGPRAG